MFCNNMYRNFILLFILLIIFVYVTQYKQEHFEGGDKNVYSNKNLFLNNDKTHNLENLNINKLCIQNPEDETDIVCIRKDELFNSLNLPEFRKHSVCIDDACITNNNVSKLNGTIDVNFESKQNRNKDGVLQCMGIDHLDVDTSERIKVKWESGRNYYGPNKPEDGWKQKCYKCSNGRKHCRPKFRGGTINGNTKVIGPDGTDISDILPDRAYRKRLSEIEYDYSIVGGSDDPIANRYGCTARHDIAMNICWASSGGKCNRKLKLKRGWTKAISRRKYEYEGSKIKNVETLKNVNCPSKYEKNNKANFIVEHGDLLSNFDLLDKKYKNTNYLINRHDEHTPIE